MKKMVLLVVITINILRAMHYDDEQLPPQVTIEDALKELTEKQTSVETSIQEIARDNQQNKTALVPNLFGLDGQECILPQSRSCCENPLLRTAFLDAIADKRIQKIVALNSLGLTMRQHPVSVLSSQLLIERYDLEKK